MTTTTPHLRIELCLFDGKPSRLFIVINDDEQHVLTTKYEDMTLENDVFRNIIIVQGRLQILMSSMLEHNLKMAAITKPHKDVKVQYVLRTSATCVDRKLKNLALENFHPEKVSLLGDSIYEGTVVFNPRVRHEMGIISYVTEELSVSKIYTEL